MTQFRLKETDIILYDYEPGQGKIIISNNYQGSFSAYWGAMGSEISSFIQRTDKHYFASKLCINTLVISAKETARNIRRHIREELNYDLPWYRYMEAQRSLRELIKDIENCDDNEHLILNMIHDIPENVDYSSLSQFEEYDMRGVLEDTFIYNEPWHFLGEEFSKEYKFLMKLHGDLKKYLAKNN